MERRTMVSRTTRDFHCQSILWLEGNYKLGLALPSRSQLRSMWRPQPRLHSRDPGAPGPVTPHPEHTDLRGRGPAPEEAHHTPTG